MTAPADASVCVLYNPVSGRGRAAAAAKEVARRVAAEGLPVTLRATEGPGHTAELARTAAREGAGRLAVAGGDGTVRDALAGLGEASIPVAIIPAGTGNDLARTLLLPRDPAGAVETLLRGREQPLDLWLWNDVLFANVAGVGLDALVADAVNRRLRRLRGTLAYLAGVATVLPTFRPPEVRLEGDDWSWSGRIMLTAVANAQYYGGGMRIAPRAEVADGLLSVVVVGAVSPLELARQMPGVFRGTHLDHPAVHCFATRHLRVEVDPSLPVTIDGELIGKLPATVTRAPYAARIMVPA